MRGQSLKAYYRPNTRLQLYSSRGLLARLSAKWTIPVLEELSRAPHKCKRFSELKLRLDGVSQRMLAATLKALEGDGLLLRRFDEVPRMELDMLCLHWG